MEKPHSPSLGEKSVSAPALAVVKPRDSSYRSPSNTYSTLHVDKGFIKDYFIGEED